MHLRNHFYLPAKREKRTCFAMIPSAAPASATVLSPSPVRLWIRCCGGIYCTVAGLQTYPQLVAKKTNPPHYKITTSPHPGPQLHPHLVVKVGQAQKIGPELNDHSAGIFPKKNPGWIGWYSHQPPKEKSRNICIYHAGGACREPCSLEFEQMNSIVAWCLDFLLHIECQQSSGLPSRWPDLLDRRAYLRVRGKVWGFDSDVIIFQHHCNWQDIWILSRQSNCLKHPYHEGMMPSQTFMLQRWRISNSLVVRADYVL